MVAMWQEERRDETVQWLSVNCRDRTGTEHLDTGTLRLQVVLTEAGWWMGCRAAGGSVRDPHLGRPAHLHACGKGEKGRGRGVSLFVMTCI